MIGYACINMSLDSEAKVNHGMIKKTFESKGLKYVSELINKNLDSLSKIFKWNVDNDILLYRMSSDMFPWMSEYNFDELPNFEKIKEKLENIGKFIKDNNIRTSFHPGPFNVLSSKNKSVVDKTIKELDKHSEIMDLMKLDQSHYYKINIHVGGAFGEKFISLNRFNENIKYLKDSTLKRLTVENDDKINLFSVVDLYE